MLGIKDMTMPSCCGNCDIAVVMRNRYCGITHSVVIDLYHRQTDCPLVEIKENEDGKIDS